MNHIYMSLCICVSTEEYSGKVGKDSAGTKIECCIDNPVKLFNQNVVTL